MPLKPEEYFKGLLNRAGTTIPQDHKDVFNKKLEDVKAKYAAAPMANPNEVAQRIKDAHAEPETASTDQKANGFKEKYKHYLTGNATAQKPSKQP